MSIASETAKNSGNGTAASTNEKDKNSIRILWSLSKNSRGLILDPI